MDAIDRAFEQESAFIARCDDVGALLDRMGDYRADGREAARRGMTKARLRAEDLVELAEERVAEIKAGAIRGKAARERAKVEASDKAARAAKARAEEEERERLEKLEAELAEARAEARKAQRERVAAEEREAARERAAERAAEERARVRRAEAERAVAEKAAAARKEQVDAAAQRERERKAAEATADRRGTAGSPGGAKAPVVRSPAPSTTSAVTANGAMASVPLPAGQGTKTPLAADVAPGERPATALASEPAVRPARTDEDSLHADPFMPVSVSAVGVVYTGADLARYRADHGLTQRLAAHQFGVAHGTIAKAEMDPAKPLGEILQTGMRNVAR